MTRHPYGSAVEDRFSHFRIATFSAPEHDLGRLVKGLFRAWLEAVCETGAEGAQLISVIDPEINSLPDDLVAAMSVSMAEAVDRIAGPGFVRLHTPGIEGVSMVGLAMERPDTTGKLDIVLFWTKPKKAKKMMPLLTKVFNSSQIPIPLVH